MKSIYSLIIKTKFFYIFFIVSLILSFNSFSQHSTFIKYYFDNYKESYAYDIIHTTDDCYVMVGVVWDHANTNNYYILKTNNSGDTLWYRENNSAFLNEALFVIETSDSGYVFSTSMYQVHLVKYDKNGNYLWEKAYGPAPGNTFTFNSLIEINQKLYGICTNYTPANTLEGLMFKLDFDGDTLLTLYNTPFTCANNINAAIKYQNDKIAMSGFVYDSINSMYIARFSIIDTNGVVLLDKPILSPQETFGFLIKESLDNGFYFSTLGSSQYICKMDSLGNILWSNDFGVGAGKYYLNIIDSNTLLLMGPEFVYMYINDSGQYINYIPFDFPFNFSPPHIANTIVLNDKIIMGGATDISFIVEYDITNVTSIFENTKKQKLFVYPNPVSLSFGQIYLRLNGLNVKQLNIYDCTGQLLEQKSIALNVNDLVSLSIEKFKPGIYFIQVIVLNNKNYMLTFIVN